MLIVVGVIFLLDTLGIVHVGELLADYWPLVLVIIGIGILLKEKRNDKKNASV